MDPSHDARDREQLLAEIEALKQALEQQARLHARQRLESLGVMAGGVAHDFNNLLTGIIGSVDLAMLDVTAEEHAPLREHLAYIQDVTEQARRLCLQLLAYSGAAPFETTPGDLSAVLADVRASLRRSARGQELRLDLVADLPPVELNAIQLQQAVLSLVRNAADAIGDDHGTITVRTGVAEVAAGATHPPSYEPLPAGRYAFVDVSDTGCGMDEETLGRILDPFFSTKLIGRGMGMAIVLGAVRAHRGVVDVRSRVGEGTTVRLLLPLLERAVEPERARGAEDAAWTGAGVVLVVDDEPLAADICARMLGSLGFSVVVAAAGAEAVERFEARAGDIVCAVVDVTMPGMSGIELLRRLRATRPGLPGLLMTGYSAEDATRGAAHEAATAVLQKPYELRTLRQRLRELLASR